MKLTVAALALLVAGASYADMAAAWEIPLRDALQRSGEVKDFDCHMTKKNTKEVCKVTFGNHPNVKATYTGQMHHGDDSQITETLSVHGKDKYDVGGGATNVDKFGGKIKANNAKGQVKGQIKDHFQYSGGQGHDDKGVKKFSCDSWHGQAAYECGWQ